MDAARGEWEAEQAEIARQKEEAEALRKAQLAQLKELETKVAAYEKKIEGLCPLIEEMGMLEDFVMIADTAKETIAAQDIATAQQLFPMIAEMEETIDSDSLHFVRRLLLRPCWRSSLSPVEELC